MDMQDAELLREYLKNGSEAAFAELVKRYVDFVYSTARRQIGDSHLAQEVAQTVFCLLARKAAGLTGCATLAGWLYRATCFTAAKTLRTEKRRRQREQEAVTMNQLDSTADGTWEHLSPMLDIALNELGEKDRLAVLLRFFQRKPMREVGEVLGVSEDAAKMRVSRAVEQLRKNFAKRGVACSPAAVGVLLTEKGVEAAPDAMASSITTAVLSGAAVSTLSFIQVLMFMAKIKAKTLAVVGIGAVVAFTAGLHVYNSAHNASNHAGDTSRAAASSGAKTNPDSAGSNVEQRNLVAIKNAADSVDAAKLAELIAHLNTVLHTKPTNDFDFGADEITQAVQAFGRNRKAVFPVLAGASADSERFVRDGAIYGLGQLGKSVPEAVPFLWDIIHSPSHDNSVDHVQALSALQNIGLGPLDIPALAELLSGPTCDHNILTRMAPEAIAQILDQNPQAAAPYISRVENLLDDSDADTRFRAALALVKYEGADNPRIFQELDALFQRPNDRGKGSGHGEYYKMLATDILQKAGSVAAPLIPDLMNFAKSASNQLIQDDAYRALGDIDPDLRNQIPEVDQALKKVENAKAWAEKWSSGSYTYDDLQAALKDPAQALTAATHLGEMGAAAESAVPGMIKSLWGQDEKTRDKILDAIHKIDPQATISRVDAHPIEIGFIYAFDAIEEKPATQENKLLLNSLQVQMVTRRSWFTREELVDFVNKLAAQNQEIANEFVKGVLSEAPDLKGLLQPAVSK